MLEIVTIDPLTGHMPISVAVDTRDAHELCTFAKDYKRILEENEELKEKLREITDAK